MPWNRRLWHFEFTRFLPQWTWAIPMIICQFLLQQFTSSTHRLELFHSRNHCLLPSLPTDHSLCVLHHLQRVRPQRIGQQISVQHHTINLHRLPQELQNRDIVTVHSHLRTVRYPESERRESMNRINGENQCGYDQNATFSAKSKQENITTNQSHTNPYRPNQIIFKFQIESIIIISTQHSHCFLIELISIGMSNDPLNHFMID